MPPTSSNSRARRSRWRSTASAKVSRAPGADLDLGGDQLAGRRLGQHLVALAGGVDVLEAVLQLQRPRVEDRELLLEPDREVGARTRISRGRGRGRGTRSSAAGQVEVERVEQVDGGAGGVDRHLRRHLQQLLGVVEDDLHPGFDEAVGDVLGGVGGHREDADDDLLLGDDVRQVAEVAHAAARRSGCRRRPGRCRRRRRPGSRGRRRSTSWRSPGRGCRRRRGRCCAGPRCGGSCGSPRPASRRCSRRRACRTCRSRRGRGGSGSG